MPAPFNKRTNHSSTEETWYDQTSAYLQSVRWNRFFARLQYLAWELGTKLVLGVIYFAIISEGFRILIPVLSQRVYELPGLGWMVDLDGFYKLDLAHLMSIFMLMAVWFFWDKILTLWFNAEIGFENYSWNRDHEVDFVLVIGFVVLSADACLFYLAVSNAGWGGSSFSLTALVATASYLVVLLFVTYVSIRLRRNLQRFKKEIYHA